ncbi:hypothetical protein EX30DRAFT_69003 [Ascodesmis nigricans]|uniref:Uncharacterized protein n=1 Tax=Ascodesmis nigricans TaxID=341454 RepID=A0A4V3SIH1_9PEZI|nr:hypothetical protein EX30DRAFT_69003 [Ascodesmis nigricans]
MLFCPLVCDHYPLSSPSSSSYHHCRYHHHSQSSTTTAVHPHNPSPHHSPLPLTISPTPHYPAPRYLYPTYIPRLAGCTPPFLTSIGRSMSGHTSTVHTSTYGDVCAAVPLSDQ